MQATTIVLFITAPLAASALLGLALTGPGPAPEQPPVDTRTPAEQSGLIPGAHQP